MRRAGCISSDATHWFPVESFLAYGIAVERDEFDSNQGPQSQERHRLDCPRQGVNSSYYTSAGCCGSSDSMNCIRCKSRKKCGMVCCKAALWKILVPSHLLLSQCSVCPIPCFMLIPPVRCFSSQTCSSAFPWPMSLVHQSELECTLTPLHRSQRFVCDVVQVSKLFLIFAARLLKDFDSNRSLRRRVFNGFTSL